MASIRSPSSASGCYLLSSPPQPVTSPPAAAPKSIPWRRSAVTSVSSQIRTRLHALFRRTKVERELDDEIRFHFEQHVEKLVATGVTRDEAIRQARLAFGT